MVRQRWRRRETALLLPGRSPLSPGYEKKLAVKFVWIAGEFCCCADQSTFIADGAMKACLLSESQTRQRCLSIYLCRDASLSPAFRIGCPRRLGLARRTERRHCPAEDVRVDESLTARRSTTLATFAGSLISWPQWACSALITAVLRQYYDLVHTQQLERDGRNAHLL
jgi:hypothetical protein